MVFVRCSVACRSVALRAPVSRGALTHGWLGGSSHRRLDTMDEQQDRSIRRFPSRATAHAERPLTADQHLTRRLAAILAADVAGYTRLMGEDETGTLLQLNAVWSEVFDPAVAQFRGRIVKTMGDGALVEFASAVDAVTCAVAIQSAMAERSAQTEERRRIEFRIGVKLGEIGIGGTDKFGDAGEVSLKNVEQPLRTWRWGEVGAPSAPTPDSSNPSASTSGAVRADE